MTRKNKSLYKRERCKFCGNRIEGKSLCNYCKNYLEEILSELSYPIKLPYGHIRLFENRKEWECSNCFKIIEVEEGYWAVDEHNYWSSGEKLCFLCFLKFMLFTFDRGILLFLEKNRYEKNRYGFNFDKEYIKEVIIPTIETGNFSKHRTLFIKKRMA